MPDQKKPNKPAEKTEADDELSRLGAPPKKLLLEPQDEMSLNDLYAMLLAAETMSFAQHLHPKNFPKSKHRPSKKLMSAFIQSVSESCAQGMEGKIAGSPRVLLDNRGDGFYPTFLVREAMSRDTYSVKSTVFIPWTPNLPDA